MLLFSMTDAQLEAERNRYYDRLYNAFYHVGDPAPVCGNCRYYADGMCEKAEGRLYEEEIREMEENNDFSEIERDKDDSCDEHRFIEEDDPPWMGGEW